MASVPEPAAMIGCDVGASKSMRSRASDSATKLRMRGSEWERTGRAPAANTSAVMAVGPGIISRVRSTRAAAAWISAIPSR